MNIPDRITPFDQTALCQFGAKFSRTNFYILQTPVCKLCVMYHMYASQSLAYRNILCRTDIGTDEKGWGSISVSTILFCFGICQCKIDSVVLVFNCITVNHASIYKALCQYEFLLEVEYICTGTMVTSQINISLLECWTLSVWSLSLGVYRVPVEKWYFLKKNPIWERRHLYIKNVPRSFLMPFSLGLEGDCRNVLFYIIKITSCINK